MEKPVLLHFLTENTQNDDPVLRVGAGNGQCRSLLPWLRPLRQDESVPDGQQPELDWWAAHASDSSGRQEPLHGHVTVNPKIPAIRNHDDHPYGQ